MTILDTILSSSGVSSGAASLIGTAANFLDPGASRLANAGLGRGASMIKQLGTPQVAWSGITQDWRVKIQLGAEAKIFYQDNDNKLMAPLRETGGLVFPFTPTVSMSYTANYTPESLTHSNYDMQFFKNGNVSAIQIEGDFAVQCGNDAQYLLAVIYFLRSATKMFFGSGSHTGSPPPIVYVSGYGDHYLPNVPCVISGFQHTMPKDVDYVEAQIKTGAVPPQTPDNAGVPMTNYSNLASGQNTSGNDGLEPSFGGVIGGNTPTTMTAQNVTSSAASTTYSTTTIATPPVIPTYTTRLPTLSSITVTLQPVYSRQRTSQFNLDKFASGEMIKNGPFGGFI